jgi:hypothetical protein
MGMRRIGIVLVVVFITSMLARTGIVDAMPRDLVLPIDCEPGRTCWIVRYVDHDPGPSAQDYACGPMSGDGHKGTDFAVRDLAAVSAGVEVRAVAPGRVAAVRDGMEDRLISARDVQTVGGRECGNGVRIDHGDGWMSLYCHLRRGSTMVLKGDQVAKGQPLGLVGLSGQTSFPHLHFDLRKDDQPIDPFVGTSRNATCGPGEAPLWSRDVRKALNYGPPLLTASGITAAVPDKADTRKGWHQADMLPSKSPSLTLWIDGYWFEQGDHVAFQLRGPDRQLVIDRAFEVGQSRQRWFSFASAPRPQGGWPKGIYRGQVRVQRAGSAINEVIGSEVRVN